MMRYFQVAAGVIFLFLLAISFDPQTIERPAAESAAPDAASTTTVALSGTAVPAYVWHKVVKVVDGDTLKIEKDGATVTVRLIGIDTPESVDPRTPVQCFAMEASEEMKRLTGSGFVRLESDPSQGTLDKYDRTLAYVYVPANARPEGALVNLFMIDEGFAHEYTYRVPYKYQTEFKAAEKRAQEGEKGLWAPGICGPAS